MSNNQPPPNICLAVFHMKWFEKGHGILLKQRGRNFPLNNLFSAIKTFGVDKNATLASVMYLDNGFTYKANWGEFVSEALSGASPYSGVTTPMLGQSKPCQSTSWELLSFAHSSWSEVAEHEELQNQLKEDLPMSKLLPGLRASWCVSETTTRDQMDQETEFLSGNRDLVRGLLFLAALEGYDRYDILQTVWNYSEYSSLSCMDWTTKRCHQRDASHRFCLFSCTEWRLSGGTCVHKPTYWFIDLSKTKTSSAECLVSSSGNLWC